MGEWAQQEFKSQSWNIINNLAQDFLDVPRKVEDSWLCESLEWVATLPGHTVCCWWGAVCLKYVPGGGLGYSLMLEDECLSCRPPFFLPLTWHDNKAKIMGQNFTRGRLLPSQTVKARSGLWKSSEHLPDEDFQGHIISTESGLDVRYSLLTIPWDHPVLSDKTEDFGYSSLSSKRPN